MLWPLRSFPSILPVTSLWGTLLTAGNGTTGPQSLALENKEVCSVSSQEPAWGPF